MATSFPQLPYMDSHASVVGMQTEELSSGWTRGAETRAKKTTTKSFFSAQVDTGKSVMEALLHFYVECKGGAHFVRVHSPIDLSCPLRRARKGRRFGTPCVPVFVFARSLFRPVSNRFCSFFSGSHFLLDVWNGFCSPVSFVLLGDSAAVSTW